MFCKCSGVGEPHSLNLARNLSMLGCVTDGVFDQVILDGKGT